MRRFLCLGLLGLALVSACSPAPPTASACLTGSDCAAGEECLFGRCTPRTDAAALTDTRAGDDAGAVDAAREDAATLDATAPDASAEDASAPPDAAPAPGESCADPIVLELVDGRAHFEAALAGYGPDHDTFCGETGAPDVVFELDVGPGLHDIDLVTGPSGLDTIIGISDGCDDFYDCDDDRTDTDKGARVVLHRYPGTRVYFMVKGYDRFDVGTFTLDVTVDVASADGLNCATALDVTGGAKVIAWPLASSSTLTTSCGGPALIDAYRLAPEADGTIASIFGWFGGVARSVSVVSGCVAPIGESYCEASTYADPAWTVFQEGVPAAGGGDHFVTVQGSTAAATSAYALDVRP